MASVPDGYKCRWSCVLVLWSSVSTLHQAVAGSCGSGDRSQKNDRNDNCWYELWYFWFIVALVFLTIAVLVIFYCKQQVKRSSGRRGRRRTPVLTMPMAPPQYEAPGYQPPPYHIAISTSVPDPAPAQHLQALPGYVVQPHDQDAYDTLSLASTISMRAFSNPPPYSPPHSASRPGGQVNAAGRDQADVAL